MYVRLKKYKQWCSKSLKKWNLIAGRFALLLLPSFLWTILLISLGHIFSKAKTLCKHTNSDFLLFYIFQWFSTFPEMTCAAFPLVAALKLHIIFLFLVSTPFMVSPHHSCFWTLACRHPHIWYGPRMVPISPVAYRHTLRPYH